MEETFKTGFVSWQEHAAWLKSLTPDQRKSVEDKGYYVVDEKEVVN